MDVVETEMEMEFGDGNVMGKRNLGMEMEFKNRNIEEKMIKKREFCEKYQGGVGIFWLKWIRYRYFAVKMDRYRNYVIIMDKEQEFCG